MTGPVPPIDSRGYDELVDQTEQLAALFSPWRPPVTGDDPGRALIRAFAGMARQVLDRLNRIPDRDLLVFLDLIGAEPLAARAATVALTFEPPDGSDAAALVPAGTSVGPDPADPDAADRHRLPDAGGPRRRARAAGRGDRPRAGRGPCGGRDGVRHGPGRPALAGFRRGHAGRARPLPRRGRDDGAAASTLPAGRALVRRRRIRDRFAGLPLEWAWWDGAAWRSVTPAWTRAGDHGYTVDLPDVGTPEPHDIGGTPGPVAAGATHPRRHASSARCPRSCPSRSAPPSPASQDRLPTAAFAGTTSADLGADVFPFGQQPAFGGALRSRRRRVRTGGGRGHHGW